MIIIGIFWLIFVVKCEYPPHQASLIEVLGFYHPAVAGTNATIRCLSGKQLTGPNTLTCMENGKWDPDPRETECKGNYSNYLNYHA